MKRFEISLIIESPDLSLLEISRLLKSEAAKCSHSKDDPRPLRGKWTLSIWKSKIECANELNFDAALMRFLKKPMIAMLKRKRKEFGRSSPYVDIAIFHDNAMCSLEISEEAIAGLAKAKLPLSCSCYPVDNA